MSSFVQREPLVSSNIGEMPKTVAVGFRLGPILRGYLPICAALGSGKCWAASPRRLEATVHFVFSPQMMRRGDRSCQRKFSALDA
jgi:hypothetical protein